MSYVLGAICLLRTNTTQRTSQQSIASTPSLHSLAMWVGRASALIFIGSTQRLYLQCGVNPTITSQHRYLSRDIRRQQRQALTSIACNNVLPSLSSQGVGSNPRPLSTLMQTVIGTLVAKKKCQVKGLAANVPLTLYIREQEGKYDKTQSNSSFYLLLWR